MSEQPDSPEPEIVSCTFCIFYSKISNLAHSQRHYGYCLRYPPSFGTPGESQHPEVYSDSWCGEWRHADRSGLKQYRRAGSGINDRNIFRPESG